MNVKNRTKKHSFLYRFDDYTNKALKSKLEELSIKQKTQYFDNLINQNFAYSNLYIKLIKEFKKQGTNLNQIARYCNEEKNANDVVLSSLKQIEKIYLGILEEIKNK